MLHGKISGTGSYLPEKILSNSDLEKIVDTSDEWIISRTGIKERHIAAENEKTSDLALRRGRRSSGCAFEQGSSGKECRRL